MRKHLLPVYLFTGLAAITSTAFANPPGNFAVPEIQFAQATASATETTSAVAGCTGYKDYTFNMQISAAPAGNANVTINVEPGGTAIFNKDYALQNSNLVFSSGATAAQQFTIRIFDDAEKENTETFTLSYAISGSSDAVRATANQTFVFSIFDNEIVPVAGTMFAKSQGVTTSAELGPNAEVYFYSSTGEMIARVKNNTAFDYGCTTIRIDRAGESTSQFWNNTPANYVTTKSYKVIPTKTNANGSYDITLYYSTAEVAAFNTAAAPTEFTNTQVVKVSNGFYIPDVSPAAQHRPDVSFVSGTVADFGTSGSSITGSFVNTGFSGFAVGSPGVALPVTFTAISAQASRNDIVVKWSVASQINILNYEVQKSADGLNFKPAASILATGANGAALQYSYTDANADAGIWYYRIKSIGTNGETNFSATTKASLQAKTALLKAYPVPVVNGRFQASLQNLPAAVYQVKIVNAMGQTVFATQVTHTGGDKVYNIEAPASLTKGNYTLIADNQTGSKVSTQISLQ